MALSYKKIIFIAVIVLILVLIVSYTIFYDGTDSIFRQKSSISGGPFPHDFIFSIFLADDEIFVRRGEVAQLGNILLRIQSRQKFDCGGRQIEFATEISETMALIKLVKLLPPAVPPMLCPDSIAPAFGEIDLGLARPLGLSFVLNDDMDEYKIIFEANIISVEPKQGSFTSHAEF